LTWSDGTDVETPESGLVYNLRIGTQPGACDVLAPTSLANLDQGTLIHNNEWTINQLPEGLYYWSVQTVDTTFTGSNWANERSFVVGLIESEQEFKQPKLTVSDSEITAEGKQAKFLVELTLPADYPFTDLPSLSDEQRKKYLLPALPDGQEYKYIKVDYNTLSDTAIEGQDY
jgi:hypothetical protein